MASAQSVVQAKALADRHTPYNPIILTNVWDVPTAKAAAKHPECRAIATASYAIAATIGVADEHLSLEANLAAIARIARVALKANKPLTVDLQSGYGDQLEHAVRSVIGLGAVGCNLEDVDTATGQLYPMPTAMSRVQRAKAAAAQAGLQDFVVNARTDILLKGGTTDDAVVRGRAYLAAGATTVFVWGGPQRGGMTKVEVYKVTKGLGGKVSVKMNLKPGSLTVRDLKEIGVARISCGPELWRASMLAFDNAVNAVFRGANSYAQ